MKKYSFFFLLAVLCMTLMPLKSLERQMVEYHFDGEKCKGWASMVLSKSLDKAREYTISITYGASQPDEEYTDTIEFGLHLTIQFHEEKDTRQALLQVIDYFQENFADLYQYHPFRQRCDAEETFLNTVYYYIFKHSAEIETFMRDCMSKCDDIYTMLLAKGEVSVHATTPQASMQTKQVFEEYFLEKRGFAQKIEL